MNIRTKDLPIGEQPFEKYRRAGILSLTDEELLALIIRKGTRESNCINLCKTVLRLAGGSLAGICGLTEAELCTIPGIGPVKAVQLIGISELARRIAKTKRSHDEPLDSAEKIAERYMEDMRHLKEERVFLLLLDSKFRLIKEITIGIGSINQSILRPREIFVQALKNEAVHIILLHNHPSGDPTPSKADIIVTKKVLEVAALVGIPLEDHLVIGDCCYVSLREEELVDFSVKGKY